MVGQDSATIIAILELLGWSGVVDILSALLLMVTSFTATNLHERQATTAILALYLFNFRFIFLSSNNFVSVVIFHKGMYMMVAGQLRFIDSANEMQYSSIRVLKIADLSNNPHSEALWMAEVIEAQLQMKNRKSC